MKELTPQEKKIVENAKKVLERTNGDITQLNDRQRELLERHYGYAFALITSSNELQRLFVTAVRSGQSVDGFKTAIRTSKWAGARDASARQYDTFSNSVGADRADFDRKVRDVTEEVIRVAQREAGVTVDAAEAKALAERVLRDNWDTWQAVLPRLVRQTYVRGNALEFGGRAYGTMQEVTSYARSMGVELSEGEIGRYVEGIATESETIESVQSRIAKTAAGLYPQFADRINAGATLESIVDPYRRTMAEMLELPDMGSIDFLGGKGKVDPLLNRALFATDEKGLPKTMGLWEFRKAIKQDERWQFTRNAEQEYSSMARDLMRMFGAGV